MKKAVLVLALSVLALGLSAHPASDVTINADFNAKTVEVAYKHIVNGKAHFIDEVKLKLNGKQIITQILSVQDNEKGGVVKYSVPELKNGDTVEADTHCNKGGNKSGKTASASKQLEAK